MKVLHISVSDDGGAGLGMMNQHLALLAQGVDSKVLVQYKKTSDKTVFEASPIATKKTITPSIIFRYWKTLIRIKYIDYLLSKIPKEKRTFFTSPVTLYDLSKHPLVKDADVINLHFVSGFLDVESFLKKVNKPIVWTMRDENPGLGGFHYTSQKEQYYDSYKRLEDYFYNLKKHAVLKNQNITLVSLSKIMTGFCKQVEFLSVKQNHIIYNAIDPLKYKLSGKNDYRSQFHLKEQDFVISFVSVYLDDERKGLNILLRALDILQDEHIKLVCVGKDRININHPSIVFKQEIKNTNDLSVIYSLSDVFISMAQQESFGKTAIESMYCGTPVISTPVGIAPEIIKGSNGFLCNRKAEDLASAIVTLRNRKYNPLEIRQHAMSMFAPDIIASKYISLYKSLCQ